MKLSSILFVSSCVVVSAFGVNPSPGLTSAKAVSPSFRAPSSLDSPLFRDVTKTRGGAVPGWAAYNDALDKNPLVTKACTSLVGWGLGDILAQVRKVHLHTWRICKTQLSCVTHNCIHILFWRSCSLAAVHLIGRDSSRFLRLVCSTTDPRDITFTTGSTSKSRASQPRMSLPRLLSTRSSGVPFS